VALLAIAALAQEQQPTTYVNKIIEIAIASIETRSATSYEITARDRTLDLITLTAPDPPARSPKCCARRCSSTLRSPSAGICGYSRSSPAGAPPPPAI
jgi:hypothetical protein